MWCALATTVWSRAGAKATKVGRDKITNPTLSGPHFLSGPRLTDVLQKLSQPLLDWRQCANAWKGVGWPVTEKNVCIGDLRSPIGVCSGDSGGPIQCRLNNGEWLQVGVTSWTTSVCNAPGYAAVFTQVSSHLDWVRNKVNTL